MIKVRAQKKLITSRGPIRLEVDFEIPDKEFITLYGPSGVGKTTVLRVIAGLTTPDQGLIEVNGKVWFDSSRKINLPVQKRSISFVFQDYNLFPNMTVEENLRFALKEKKDGALIPELLEMVELSALSDRKPVFLSGGQKQRVALIRALLRKPKIFLLDEPLSALDIGLRAKLQNEIAALYQRLQIPTIFVTHDLSEIFKLANRILVMEEGKIIRSGPPAEVFGRDGLSGKFKFVGIILELKKEDFLFIVTIQIGENLTKVVATEEEARGMRPGDRVIVAAKAFNPIILPVT